MREWKPGDVAIGLYPEWVADAEEPQYVEMRVSRYSHGWARLDEPDDFLNDDGMRPGITALRPLVVIDPEDREAVGRLIKAVRAERFHDQSTEAMQAALRSLVTPPKPEVYEHLAVGDAVGCTVRALCGKVWTPNDRSAVTVAGKCPECAEITKAGWTA